MSDNPPGKRKPPVYLVEDHDSHGKAHYLICRPIGMIKASDAGSLLGGGGDGHRGDGDSLFRKGEIERFLQSESRRRSAILPQLEFAEWEWPGPLFD